MTDEKPIRLRVVSVMTDPDGGRHESKTVHRGTLRAGEDGLEIAYEQVDEGVRARICLTWTADGVRMRRTGEMTGALHFQPGRKTAGLYGTAYGDIPVAVYTREVLSEGRCRLSAAGNFSFHPKHFSRRDVFSYRKYKARAYRKTRVLRLCTSRERAQGRHIPCRAAL